eukprot:7121114-Alexandrium_andersonii.AAC.1
MESEPPADAWVDPYLPEPTPPEPAVPLETPKVENPRRRRRLAVMGAKAWPTRKPTTPRRSARTL